LDKRLSFPREWPYYLGWNAQASKTPGTTMFYPLVDCTWQYINALLILAAEPDGKRPLFLDDWRQFKPKGPFEWMAKIAGSVGLAEKIPYHPIGGLKWVRNGFVSKDSPGPLGWIHTMRTDYEAFFYFQNLMLLAQSMGLGGWIHGAVFNPYIYMDDPAKGLHGLGMRFQQPKTLSPLAPVPVDRVIEMKYGKTGSAYGNEDVFARPYRNRDDARAYVEKGTKFGPKQIEYVKDICNYLYDTYGRFPAHVDAFYAPGMWLQVSHLEMEYYDRFFDPAQYTRQAAHDAKWHK